MTIDNFIINNTRPNARHPVQEPGITSACIDRLDNVPRIDCAHQMNDQTPGDLTGCDKVTRAASPK